MNKSWVGRLGVSFLMGLVLAGAAYGFMLGYFKYLGGTGGSSIQGPGIWTIPVLPGFIAGVTYEMATVNAKCGLFTEEGLKSYDEELEVCFPKRADATQACKDYHAKKLERAQCYLENEPPRELIMNFANLLFYWAVSFILLTVWKISKSAHQANGV